MKLLNFVLLCMLFIRCNNYSCLYNESANDKWIADFKTQKLGVLIKDSLKRDMKADDKISVRTFNLSDTIKKEYTIISIQEEMYIDPCQAKKRFEDDLKYYQSENPKYEMNDGPHFGLLQGSHYYFVNANANWDTLSQKVFTELERSLLSSTPDKGSTFTRYTYKKAELK
jgi:hypothetical protein